MDLWLTHLSDLTLDLRGSLHSSHLQNVGAQLHAFSQDVPLQILAVLLLLMNSVVVPEHRKHVVDVCVERQLPG